MSCAGKCESLSFEHFDSAITFRGEFYDFQEKLDDFHVFEVVKIITY